MVHRVTLFPECIIIRVRHEIFPKSDTIAHNGSKVFYRSCSQVKIIGVGCRKIIVCRSHSSWCRSRLSKTFIKTETVHLEKCTVMMEVVTDKPFCYRGLWANSL